MTLSAGACLGGAAPTAVRVDASGLALLVASFGDHRVPRFAIDAATGALRFTDSEPAGTNSASLDLVGTQ